MYLYIYEDKCVRMANERPTDEHLELVQMNLMRIVTLVGGRFVVYEHDRSMKDIPFIAEETDGPQEHDNQQDGNRSSPS